MLRPPYAQVASRLLLPASALFEAALSVASLALSNGGVEVGSMLTHAAIIAPCTLPLADGGALTCLIDTR